MLIGKVDDNGYAAEIRGAAIKNGVEDQIHFIPETSEIVRYYRASSVVIIPSVSEGFSLVCLEAMACGLITVATETVGIHKSVIEHGRNGFLFPVNDDAALNRILDDVISGKTLPDPGEIRKTIVEKWSADNNVRELLKAYNNS
jgi:mannosyltransferase